MKTPPRNETARVTGDLKLEIGWSTGETLPIDWPTSPSRPSTRYATRAFRTHDA